MENKTLDLDQLQKDVKAMEHKVEMILDELTDKYPHLEITIYSGQQKHYAEGIKNPVAIINKVDTSVTIPDL